MNEALEALRALLTGAANPSVPYGEEWGYCLWCNSYETDPHQTDCAWVRAQKVLDKQLNL
jgi:hypothetical protein